MKVKRQCSLAYKIEKRIMASSCRVILSRDLYGLSDKTQVSRALRTLVKQGKLVKIGYGVFSKPLFYSERLKKPVIDFWQDSREALNRFNVKWELGKAAQDYNSGRSTQVPVKISVKLNSRFSRRLCYGNSILRYE